MDPTTLIAGALWALAVGGLAWALLDVLFAERTTDPEEGFVEVERREAMRAGRPTYRWFEPWIDELATMAGTSQAKRLPAVRDDLIGSGEPIKWKPSEYLAISQVESLVAGMIGLSFGWVLGGAVVAVVFGLMGLIGYQSYASWALKSRSSKRRQSIRRRIAPAFELMSLMIEVGASFPEALATVAEEAKDHPLGAELAMVLHKCEHGTPRPQALTEFAQRVADEDVRDLMAAVVQGEALGTPLAETIRTQAEQLRLKRTQWAEKAAEESKVALVFPAMLIMSACLAIVVAPFILGAFYLGAT